VAKELLGYSDATFLLGDFMGYMREESEQFDLCVASGVLYHMRTPVETLELIAERASRLLLWTHYYDENAARSNPALAGKFTERTEHEHRDFRYALHRYEYLEALERSDFCGATLHTRNGCPATSYSVRSSTSVGRSRRSTSMHRPPARPGSGAGGNARRMSDPAKPGYPVPVV